MLEDNLWGESIKPTSIRNYLYMQTDSKIKGLMLFILVISGFMIAIPSMIGIANAFDESYRGVKISHFLHGVSGFLNTKFNKMGDAKDFMVYLNFDQEETTIGAGHYTVMSGGVVSNCDMIYYAIDGGLANRDLRACNIGYPTRYSANVIQDGNPSNCYIATTFGGNYEEFCLSVYRATIAGAISHTHSDYSSTNTLNHKFDRLKTWYWSNVQGAYLGKYFTDVETDESKCWSSEGVGGSWVEDDLMHRAPNGSASDVFDDIGSGPESFTVDDCDSDSFVWRPYAIE